MRCEEKEGKEGNICKEQMGFTGNEDLGTLVDVDPSPLILVLISEAWELVCH